MPLIITGLFQSSTGFLENVFLAQLGQETMAAGALVSWLFFILMNLMFGLLNAVNVLIAYKHGEGDKKAISQILRDGLFIASILTVLGCLLLWNIAPIYGRFGQEASLVTLATLYLHALTFALPAKLILMVLFEFIIGLGKTKLSMISALLSIPLYLFFSYSLIFGAFGFPALGISGAGFGIAIGDWLMALAFFTYLFYHKEYRFYLKGTVSAHTISYLGELIRLGLPMGLMFCAELSFFFVLSLLMGKIHISVLAANQLTMQYMGPLMGLVFCLAQAITVRMGHLLGVNKPIEAKQTAIIGVIIALLFMLCVGLCYWFIPKTLISVDFNIANLNNKSIVSLATQFLWVAALFQIFEAIRVALFGALRGLKDTHYTFHVSLFSFWGVSLPLGYGLNKMLGGQGVGYWWGMVIGASVSALFLWRRFHWKMKQYKNAI